jgi:hypothetical protein
VDDTDQPVLEYVDGADEVLSAIAELPGVEWTLAGRIYQHPHEKMRPVRILVRTSDAGDQDLFIMFHAHTADQSFSVSLPDHGDRLAYIERIAACVRSFGYDCITATKFLKTKSRSVTPWLLQERGPAPAPFFPPLGDAMKKKLKPNRAVTPDKRAELDRDGRELFQTVFDTPGVANVRAIGMKANVCGDTEPVIINGQMASNLILTCYSPQTEYTFQVIRSGATNPDEIRRKIERRIREVKFAAVPPPPPRPAPAPPPAQAPVAAKTRKLLAHDDWDDTLIRGIRCLMSHAHTSGDQLRVDIPGGCLRDLWPNDPSMRTRVYTALCHRGVLTDGQEISGPKRKSFALVLPTIPGVTWDAAPLPAPVPIPPSPPPPPPVTPPPSTEPFDSVPEPAPPAPTLESLTQSELQTLLHELNVEFARRGWTLLVHNGEAGIFFPLDPKPQPTESS